MHLEIQSFNVNRLFDYETPKVSDNTVFITGINCEMGLGHVKNYLQIGAKVVGTARNVDTCGDLIKF